MEITVSGVDRILKRLQRFDNLQDKLMELAYRLCEIGMTVCDSVYHTTADIYVERTETGAKVVVSGEKVLFIEFGTGDMAGATVALYDEVPPQVGRGTWSATHAQQYTTYGFWWFGGRTYEYTPPHPATYNAYQEMVQAIPRVAKEVFV